MLRRLIVLAAVAAGAGRLDAQAAAAARPAATSPGPAPMTTAPAPGPDSLSLALGDAVARAFRTGDEAQIADALVDVADAQVGIARSAALPQLRLANTSYTHTIQSARGQAVGSLFNQANTYTLAGNLSQTIFQGGRAMAGWRSSNRLADAAVLTREETRDDIALSVTRAYLTVLLNRELLAIQEANARLADDRLAQVVGFEKAGRAARYDVLRARVERSNLEPLLIQARSDVRISELDLKRLVNVPADRPLRLTTAIDAAGVAAVAAQVAADTAADVSGRPVLRAAELTARARHDAITVARADLLPTISVFAQTGYQAFPTLDRFPTAVGRFVEVDCPAGSTAGKACTAQNGGWFDDRSVGVQISWAPFDGLRTKGNIDAAQAQARLADVQLAQQREAVALDVARARAEFERARSAFDANKQNAAEAEEAFRLAQVRFTRGLGTQLDVSDAQIALMTARTNQARATNDLYLAAAGVERAVGRALPLPDGSVVPQTNRNR
jgi:outer membrane protein TolC